MAWDDEKGGRPPKEGLDYFYLETRLDSKFAFLQADVRQKYTGDPNAFIYVCAARDIVLRMFQKIYDEKGWYYPWDDDHKLLWVEQEKLGMDFTTYVIDRALRRKIFHQETHRKYEVLTSKGLQDRFYNATYRRAKVILYKELILTDGDLSRNNIIIKSVSDSRNQSDIKFSIEEVEEATKDKKKASTPERSKVKEITEKLVELWNAKNDTRLRFLDSKVRQVERRLRTFSPKELQESIINRASDPWIAKNNQQSNWDKIFDKDKYVDEWLNRQPKNGRTKDFNPAKSEKWLTIKDGKAHAEYHRKELTGNFYELVEYKGQKYVSPKFTNETNVPELQT